MKTTVKKITVKLVATLIAVLTVAAVMTLTVLADPVENTDNSVYISVSYDDKYISDKNGDPIAYVPISFEKLSGIDLNEYGLAEFLYDENNDGIYDITALHLIIYAHEELYGGDFSEVTFTGSPGSSYFAGGLFGKDENLNYYLNGEYPLASSGWGATSDQIVLEPGDFIDLAGFTSWDFYADSAFGFHFFSDNEGKITHNYVAKTDTACDIKLIKGTKDFDYNSVLVDVPYCEVYYGTTLYDAVGSVLTDGNGCASINFPTSGTWYMWVDGGYGNEFPDSIVSAPGYCEVVVEQAELIPKIIAEGSCGTLASWKLDDEGMLTIYGEGSTFYYTGKSMPWYDYKEDITKVVIEEGIVSIGASSFYEFANVTEVVLPNGLKAIGQYAFYGCSSVTELIIPESVYYIGNYAFRKTGTDVGGISLLDPNGWYRNGEAMTSEFMSNVEAVTDDFRRQNYTANWNKVSKDPTIVAEGTCGKTATWTLDSNGTLTISGTGYMTEFLTKGAPWFNYNASIINVVIEEGIKKVGKCSFYGADNILSVQLPESLEIISPYAFYYCRNLKEVNIPANVTTIGQYAFRQCKALTSIDLGIKYGWSASETPFTSTELTAEGAVYYFTKAYYTAIWTRDVNAEDDSDPSRLAAGICGDNLKWQLNVYGTLTISGSGAMTNYNSAGDTLPWKSYADQITKVVIEEGVTSIGDYAFYNVFTKIESVILPETLTSIGKYAFYGASGAKELTVPASVTSIGTMAFRKMGATGKLSVTFSVIEGWTCGGNAISEELFTDAKTAGSAFRSAAYAGEWTKL